MAHLTKLRDFSARFSLSADPVFLALLSLLIACSPPAWPKPLYRPSKEYRTINTDVYEISVQKNGRIDVNAPSGLPFFNNACPMILLDGEETPKALPVDPRFTGRMEVNDRLGKGQGLAFTKGTCRWYIRTYPAKPFIVVYLEYVNTSKKPVRVAKLIPFSVGLASDGVFNIGNSADQTFLLENGRLFRTFNDYAEVVRRKSLSQWNLAAYNPASGQSLIAGFLTCDRAYTQIEIERTAEAKPNGFDLFRAECVYDPPALVPPKGTLKSEVLYLSVGEANPLTGLERYAKAMAVMNGVRDERPFVPHGWDSWSTQYGKNIDEATMLRNLDFVDQNLKRYGWKHFAIDAGWERGPADWEAHPEKFPHGMKWFAEEIHLRGMTAGIWIDPFTVPKDAKLAQEHPEWMAAPHTLGCTLMGDNKWILDVTAPGAYEYVRALCAKIGQEWGYDALMEADFTYHLLLAEKYADPNLTRIEVLHRGLRAIREGFGEGKFIMGMTPQPVTALYADGIRVGHDCAPVWRSEDRQGPWGGVQSLTNAIRRSYFAPHLYLPDQDCAFFGHAGTRERWKATGKPELTWNQSLAWLTGAVLTGGVVKIGEPFAELSPAEVGILRKLLPSPESPARPMDLFQEGPPRIWYLPLRTNAGEWQIIGVFNWDETQPQTVPISFANLGLDPAAYYTVYDFWQEQYHGTAQGWLEVRPPVGGVSLLGLRRFENRPMLLSSNRHFTQGASDHTALAWDPVMRQLRGTFTGVADTDYTLTILTPAPYTFQGANVPTSAIRIDVEERLVRLSFHVSADGLVDWVAQF